MKPIYIEWLDSQSIDDWTELKDIEMNFKRIRSLGWLVKETAAGYAVALSEDEENGMYACTMEIPRCSVTRIMFLPEDLFGEG